MTPPLTDAYELLGYAQALVDECDPGTVAAFEQRAAEGRGALAAYGIDLDRPDQRDAVVAVVNLFTRVYGAAGPDGIATALPDLQQALIAATRTAPTSTDRSTP